MDPLKAAIGGIEPLDQDAVQRAKRRTEDLLMPYLALGRLHEISWRVAGIMGRIPEGLPRKVVMVAAGDHGVASEGVSLFPQEVTRQMVSGFIRGLAAINVISRHVGARVVVVDFGVKGPTEPSWLEASDSFYDMKVAPGTGNIATGPAMSRQQASEAILRGTEVFRREASKGLDIIATGDMGIANTTPSAAVISVLTGSDPEEIVGRGTGLDDEGLRRKAQVVRRALEVNRPDPRDPLDVLAKVGGFEIGGLCGWILAGAKARVPVVIDGFISTAAALLAVALEPRARDYLFAGHLSAERGHSKALEHLGLEPLLQLEMRLGEGTGATLAFVIIEAAVKILSQMATFESAGVSRGL
ncbi:MAG: nicotinate-nucleotide--dimethylbenzimidazole phosphoribosyltransferase [Deltaproteobacteria bacterium]|nr:MAG: nicotinate-nucleotide--dimethylbenzimidazole phosphoribosyltransferase [Deltaproteobacteria bacterium]